MFSLKNPSYPEYLCLSHCGVLCVDIHPNHPHMMAVGLADGNVAVYNLQKQTYKPAYISTARNGKHQDIVWQVSICYLIYISDIIWHYIVDTNVRIILMCSYFSTGEMGKGQS